MKVLKTVLLVFVLLISSTVIAQDDADENNCELSYLFNTWARPSPPAAPNGAVFGQLVHIGAMHDTLVSASTEAAEVVELHEMVVGDDDVMQMREVEGGFMVPPNSFLDLKPGGLHIMLIGLTQDLVAGEHIELTLTFENAGDVPLTVPVKDMMMGEMAMEMDADSEMESDMDQMAMPMMDWPEACATMHVLDPWARPAVPGAPNSAAYGLLVNLTETDDMLVAAETDAAEVVELHEMTMGEGDVMRMRQLEDGIAVPAGGAALMQPGGLHIMLINLTADLVEGDSVEFTLSFMENEDLSITAPVRPMEMDGMGGMGMGGMNHGDGEGEDDDS